MEYMYSDEEQIIIDHHLSLIEWHKKLIVSEYKKRGLGVREAIEAMTQDRHLKLIEKALCDFIGTREPIMKFIHNKQNQRD